MKKRPRRLFVDAVLRTKSNLDLSIQCVLEIQGPLRSEKISTNACQAPSTTARLAFGAVEDNSRVLMALSAKGNSLSLLD